MRNPARIYKICVEIAQLWAEKCPDWRFCQLMDNFFSYKRSDCFYVEDEDFIAELKKFLETL